MLRETVRNLAGGDAVAVGRREGAAHRAHVRLPARPALEWLVGLSADAVAAELAAEDDAASR